MKHAYLILAHNEFEILRRLIESLDDKRNDIYVHFDAKVEVLPDLEVQNANLYILENRVDVKWGDVTVMEAELNLFEAASKRKSYDYYHVLSGVDMPIKSQDYIHDFFNANKGKEFIGFYTGDIKDEIDRKVRRVHLFSDSFRPEPSIFSQIKRVLRAGSIKIQELTGYKKNRKISFRKGTQWLSVTDGLVKLILKEKANILKIYQNSFCCDEIVVQTICWNSVFKNKLFDLTDEGRGCMREIRWENNVIRDWTDEDFEYLINSDKLFARKFNSKSINVVDKILHAVQVNKT
ncbi:beta-1,6-N-acetylglucosaminyltransferase [Sphingobacterium cellulitidis]